MPPLDLECRDTIAALLTGSSDGVVSIVRISGPAAADVRDRLFKRRRPGSHRPATLHLGSLMGPDGSARGEILCATFPAGRSYTGETSVELQGYGGRINAHALLQAALGAGARQALPGEFTLRAYLHGRVSLDQAEAVAALLGAQTEDAARHAQRLHTGLLATALEPLREGMLALLAETEAYLDFPDDGLPPRRQEAQRMLALDMADALKGLLKGHERSRRMLEGARVVLWGAPNAGKSTLLNALCGEARAIVDEEPGTTRDVVEARVTWEGMPVHLLDTAGVRTGADRVEQEGVRRTHAEAQRADLVLYCVPTDARVKDLVDPPGGRSVLVVETKGDLASSQGAAPGVGVRVGAPVVTVSAPRGEGLPELREAIMRHLAGTGRTREGHAVTATARQGELLERAARALREAVRVRDEGEPEEVVAQWFRIAAEALGEVSGDTIPTEEVLGAIFNRFCIGK